MSRKRKDRNEKAAEKSTPEVQNIVSCGSLNNKNPIDLDELSFKIQGCRYNSKRFPAVVFRKSTPKCTILCFKSGKIIVIGAKSNQGAEVAARLGINTFKKPLLLPDLNLKHFGVTNIVANAAIGFKINIAELAKERLVSKNQRFPGVVYKGLQKLAKSILIFASGKMVFTGCRSIDDIDYAFIEMQNRMLKYKLSDNADIGKQLVNVELVVQNINHNLSQEVVENFQEEGAINAAQNPQRINKISNVVPPIQDVNSQRPKKNKKKPTENK